MRLIIKIIELYFKMDSCLPLIEINIVYSCNKEHSFCCHFKLRLSISSTFFLVTLHFSFIVLYPFYGEKERRGPFYQRADLCGFSGKDRWTPLLGVVNWLSHFPCLTVIFQSVISVYQYSTGKQTWNSRCSQLLTGS